MIVTEESTTRVERVEWRMRVETGVPVIGCLILAIYFASLADSPVEYLAVVGVIVVGILLFISGIRRRQVCVIEPTRIGYGYIGGKMWWHDRDRLGSVLVRKDLLLQARFYDRDDGRMFGYMVFAFFDPKELRQAFDSAGIPVR